MNRFDRATVSAEPGDPLLSRLRKEESADFPGNESMKELLRFMLLASRYPRLVIPGVRLILSVEPAGAAGIPLDCWIADRNLQNP